MTPRGREALPRGNAFSGKEKLVHFYSEEFTIYQFFFTDMCYTKNRNRLREA